VHQQDDRAPAAIDALDAGRRGRHRTTVAVVSSDPSRSGLRETRKTPQAMATRPTTSKAGAAPAVEMQSPRARAPMATLTTGSTTVRVGSDQRSGPAWKALWTTTMATTAQTTRA